MKTKFITLAALSGSLAWAAVSVNVPGTTQTQATIRYALSASTGATCLVEISESPSYTPLAHDVDPTLFSGSNHDNRGGSIASGNFRIFIAGTRGAAQQGTDGHWYSRALAAYTIYYGRINNDGACDSGGAVTFTFVTAPAPPGRTYGDPIPVAASNPGVSAYPQQIGTSRTPLIDPQTGIVHIPVSVPGDQPVHAGTGTAFQAPFDHTSAWTLTSGALPATYSGTNQAKLFLPVYFGNGVVFASYENLSRSFPEFLLAHITGSVSTGTAVFNFCLTIDSLTCAGSTLQATFTGTPTSYPIGGTNPGFTDWGSPEIDYKRAALRPNYSESTTLTVNGAVVTLTGNGITDSRFTPPYAAGTPITLSGTGCNQVFQIAGASSDTDSAVTLSSSPSCGAASFTLNTYGVLAWANTSSAITATIGSASNFDWQTDYETQEDSSPMQLFANQAGGPAVTIGGCGPYYAAYHFTATYLESPVCRDVKYLGQWNVSSSGVYSPATQGIPVGTSSGGGACVMDPTTILRWTCGVNAVNNDMALVQVTYNNGGSFANIPQGTQVNGTAGTTSCTPTPCLNATNLAASVLASARAFSAAFAADTFPSSDPSVDGGCPDGTLLVRMQLASQGTTGWLGVYQVGAGIVALRKSTASYNVTGGTFHSAMPRCSTGTGSRLVGYNAQLGPIGSGGALSGTDTAPGLGPYRVRVAGGLNTSVGSCPAWPGSSSTPIAQMDWPGGANNATNNNCGTYTFASNEWEDPSPYQATATVGVTHNSAAVTSSGAFISSDTGKPIVISGATYTMTYVDSSDITVSPAVSATTGSYTAAFEREPPCSFTGLTCDVSTDYGLRPIASGDKAFVGAGTSGVSCYFSYQACLTEAILFLTNTAGDSWIIQRNYGGQETVKNWSGSTYLYTDSGNQNFFILNGGNANWDDVWNTTTDPTGSLFQDLIDYKDESGHGNRESGEWTIFDQTANSPAMTRWDGGTFRGTYASRLGANFTYINAPFVYNAYSPGFAGIVGLGNTNDVDTHSSWPYASLSGFILDGKPLYGWSGGNNGTNVSSTLYKFNYVQRGFSSAALAITADKVMPWIAKVGHHPLLNISGPGSVINGTSSSWYKYCTVLLANECVIGSNPGDLYVNAPGASIPGPNTNVPIGTNGGNVIDILVAPNGVCTQATAQVDITRADPISGSTTRCLGHTFAQYAWHSPFWNVRATPDGLGMLSQVFGMNGGAAMETVMTVLPPIIRNSVNGADFVPLALQLNPPAGHSINNAVVEFGYAENGNPASGLFCTPRQEACVKGNQSGNLFNYETSESGSYAGQPCSTTCAVTLPAISGRTLYYRVKFQSGSAVQVTTQMDVIPVP